MHKHYDKNTKGRDFIVGDLHGCYDMLMHELKELYFDKTIDRLFSVGDLIDRGTQSIECLRLIQEDWFHTVIGNHEDMFISAVINGETPNLWYANGGLWSIDEDPCELLYLAELADKLPLAITIDGSIGICHAQPPSLDWANAVMPDFRSREGMIWGRSWIANKMSRNVFGIDQTFHGHTPVKDVVAIGNVNFVDTGAVFKGGKLTILEI